MVGAGTALKADYINSAAVISGSEKSDLFGNLSQYADGIDNQALACGPTASINSLTFLLNTHPGLFAPMSLAQLDSAAQVNQMEKDTQDGAFAGWTLQEMYAAKQAYLKNNTPTSYIYVGMTNWKSKEIGAEDSAKDLAQLLEMGEDVELQITPPGGGLGHIVDLTGITWDPTGKGSGTISLMDSLIDDDGKIDPYTADISASADGYLNVASTTVDDQSTQGGTITGYVEESVVRVTPEPSTTWLLLSGLAGLLGYDHWKRRRAVD